MKLTLHTPPVSKTANVKTWLTFIQSKIANLICGSFAVQYTSLYVCVTFKADIDKLLLIMSTSCLLCFVILCIVHVIKLSIYNVSGEWK